MPTVTTILTVGALAVSGASSAAQAISGNKQAKEAKKAMDNFQYSETTNAYANLAPSTKGAELQAENVARQSATLSEQASSAGARGVVGMAPQIAEQTTQSMREIAASMDQAQAEYDRMLAQGEMQRQQMVQAREQQELAGIGQLYNVGQQNMWNGIGGLAQTAVGAAGMFGGSGAQASTPQQSISLPYAQQAGTIAAMNVANSLNPLLPSGNLYGTTNQYMK